MSGVACLSGRRSERQPQNVAARRRVRHRRLLSSPGKAEAARKSRNRVCRVDLFTRYGSHFRIEKSDFAQVDAGERVVADRVHHDLLQSKARKADQPEPFRMWTS